MKRLTAIFLILCLITPCLLSCKNEEKREIKSILFLGDDLMETSGIFNLFYKLCKANGHFDITVDYECIEDARMYTFADLCDKDTEFANRVKKADVIVFEEGTAETETTADSITRIINTANDPVMACLCLYGYPCWMYREDFEEKKLKNIKYIDADYFIKKIIAAEGTPIGYEHLCLEDYIHPNILNGFLSSVVAYCELFDTMPEYINLSPFDDHTGIAGCADVKAGDVSSLVHKLSNMINDEMK